jgi:hypothetical protein
MDTAVNRRRLFFNAETYNLITTPKGYFMVINSVASEKFITALTFKNFLNIRLLLHLPPQAISLTSLRNVKGRKG